MSVSEEEIRLECVRVGADIAGPLGSFKPVDQVTKNAEAIYAFIKKQNPGELYEGLKDGISRIPAEPLVMLDTTKLNAPASA